MPEFINITGQMFGKLTAIKRVGEKHPARWLFRCECGNEKEIVGYSVRTGKTKTCGCFFNKDISGKKFGRLTAIKFSRMQKKIAFWLFRCDCGNEKEINKYSVFFGDSKSCGCYLKEVISKTNTKDLTGQKFGFITVIKKTVKVSGTWKYQCVCKCGQETEITGANLSRGNTTSCGCKNRFRSKEAHPNWKGGKIKTSAGYLICLTETHPFASSNGYVMEHRLIMEKMIGRYLLSNENVHHINGKRDDNRPENLEIWATCQPKGQRPKDLVAYSLEILKLYAPEMLST